MRTALRFALFLVLAALSSCVAPSAHSWIGANVGAVIDSAADDGGR